MFPRSTILALAMMSICAASVWGQTTVSFTRTTTLPPFGLGSTETASVIVLNAVSGTAASCTGSISFLNSTGTAIGTATPFTVTAGQTASATLPFASSTLTGVRGTIRASVTLTAPTGAAVPCNLQITVSTFDTSTGATHLFLSSSAETLVLTPLPIAVSPIPSH